MCCAWPEIESALIPESYKDSPHGDDKCLWEHTMWNNGHDAYLESRVLAAEPVELVNLLYQACIQAVRDARHHLAQGDIAERSRSINKACEIVMELNSSLDRAQGGEIALRLAQLYDYMLTQLLEANMQQQDAPLSEVLSLLATLAEAWEGVCPALEPVAPASNVWSHEADPAAYTSHGWSL
jgi:flagellar protein FliS